MQLSPLQEEILSYLCGLAPVGQPFQIERSVAAKDLRLSQSGVFNHVVRRLTKLDAVLVDIKGTCGTPATMRVMKRPEAFQKKATIVMAQPTQVMVERDPKRHPCLDCRLADCDEASSQCELRVVMREYRKFQRNGRQAPTWLSKLSALANDELYRFKHKAKKSELIHGGFDGRSEEQTEAAA